MVVFYRDEQKQYQMAQEFPHEKFPQLRFFIGDFRDRDRLKRALMGIDFVIHATAIKNVHIAEYKPDECIKQTLAAHRMW